MGRECSTNGREDKCVETLARKLKELDHFKYMDVNGRILIQLAQDRNHKWVLVNTVISLQTP
jgi:hypothetical protein